MRTALSHNRGFVRPGKMVDWDGGDKYDIDADGIPDFADGFNWDCLPDDPPAGGDLRLWTRPDSVHMAAIQNVVPFAAFMADRAAFRW